MASDTARAAANVLREQVQRAVQCVNSRVQVRTGARDASGVAALLADNDIPFPLRSPGRLALHIRLSYRVVALSAREYEGYVTSYAYALNDADTAREILAYHWHPETRNSVPFPHLHLSAGSGQLRPEYARAHLDTGRITLARMLHLAVRDFGAGPVRDDWRRVLDDAHALLDAAW